MVLEPGVFLYSNSSIEIGSWESMSMTSVPEASSVLVARISWMRYLIGAHPLPARRFDGEPLEVERSRHRADPGQVALRAPGGAGRQRHAGNGLEVRIDAGLHVLDAGCHAGPEPPRPHVLDLADVLRGAGRGHATREELIDVAGSHGCLEVRRGGLGVGLPVGPRPQRPRLVECLAARGDLAPLAGDLGRALDLNSHTMGLLLSLTRRL